MNKNELKHILENNFLDILQKIFNYMSEELAQTNEQDIKALEKIDNELKEKIELLKQEFNLIDENKKESISNLLSEYISTRDYISAYYNEKYFKERSKNWNKINRRNNKIKPQASVNLRKTLAFYMKKYVYLIVIHKIKCIYAKSHAFRLSQRISITPSSCKIIL